MFLMTGMWHTHVLKVEKGKFRRIFMYMQQTVSISLFHHDKIIYINDGDIFAWLLLISQFILITSASEGRNVLHTSSYRNINEAFRTSPTFPSWRRHSGLNAVSRQGKELLFHTPPTREKQHFRLSAANLNVMYAKVSTCR